MSVELLSLFGDMAPTWTTKELLISLGSALGLIVPVALFAVRYLTASARRRARNLAKEKEDLQNQLTKIETTSVPKITELEYQLERAKQESQSLATELAATKDREATLLQTQAQEQTERTNLHQDLTKSDRELEAERRRIERAMQSDGQIWTERVLGNCPEFKPLDPEGRRTPIISVLNLKGGVGKTTLVANLGAALDRRGFRTLMLDLDLQGSLTSLYIDEDDHVQIRNQRKLLGDFLAASFDAEFPNLLNYVRYVLPEAKSAIVPTADDVAYAEMNLTIRWFLRDSRRDPRFLLRKELHMRRVTNDFDVVLMDCPPLMNVSCVNALAASDYVMIPILPSRQATARVPVLLQRLKEFREQINPALKVLGIVCNRTLRSELTSDEANRLLMLRGLCVDVWGEDVKQFDTFVRQSPEIRNAEDEHRCLMPGDLMSETFASLAREIEDRLPMFCRPAVKSRAEAAS